MDWLEIFIETTHEGIEIVSGLLCSYGITGLIVEDKEDFESFLENPNREWDYIEDNLVKEKEESPTGITFFIADDLQAIEMIATIKGNLKSLKDIEKEFDLGSLCSTIKNVKESDWANNWKKYFKPLPIGNKIIIKPSWEELTEVTDRKVLEIDPGQIFGTGGHETTQMCIEFIEKYINVGDKAIDIGCGSGILAIASLLLGAEYTDAVDIDPNAIKIVTDNMNMNRIHASAYSVYAGNILEDKKLIEKFKGKKYDIVEANIVADVIIGLCDIVPEFIKDNGIFISSGIISGREDHVADALEQSNFKILDISRKKDWIAIASRYKG